MSVKPYTPEEAADAKVAAFPDFVMETWNEVIAKNLTGNRSTFTQDEVIRALLGASPEGTRRQDVFNGGWLDMEPEYRKAGWEVVYDKPGYNESYGAKFVFKKARPGHVP